MNRSPDAVVARLARLVAMRTRPGTVRSVYLVESSPRAALSRSFRSYPYRPR